MLHSVLDKAMGWSICLKAKTLANGQILGKCAYFSLYQFHWHIKIDIITKPDNQTELNAIQIQHSSHLGKTVQL